MAGKLMHLAITVYNDSNSWRQVFEVGHLDLLQKEHKMKQVPLFNDYDYLSRTVLIQPFSYEPTLEELHHRDPSV